MRIRRLIERSEPWVGLADQAVARGAGLITTIWLVRSLGLATFGAFALANLVVLGVLAVYQALFVQPLATFVEQEQGAERAAYLRTARRLAAWGALGSAGLGMGLAFLLLGSVGAGPWAALLPAIGLTCVGRCLHTHARGEAYAQRRPSRALELDAVQAGTLLSILLGLSLTGWLSVASVLAAQGTAGLLAAVLRRERCLGRAELGKGWRGVLDQHWGHGRWLALMGLVQWGGSNAYVVAAAALVGPSAAGAIRAAQTLVGAVLVLANAVDDQLPVRLARLRVQAGSIAIDRALRRLCVIAGSVAALASLLLFWGAELIVGAVYGPGQAGAVIALTGLAWLPIGSALFTVMQSAYRAEQSTGVLSAIYLAWTCVALLVSEPLVSSYGLRGATFGMSMQQLGLALSLMWVWFLRFLPTRDAKFASE